MKYSEMKRMLQTILFQGKEFALSETELSGPESSKEIGDMARRDRSCFIRDGRLEVV